MFKITGTLIVTALMAVASIVRAQEGLNASSNPEEFFIGEMTNVEELLICEAVFYSSYITAIELSLGEASAEAVSAVLTMTPGMHGGPICNFFSGTMIPIKEIPKEKRQRRDSSTDHLDFTVFALWPNGTHVIYYASTFGTINFRGIEFKMTE